MTDLPKLPIKDARDIARGRGWDQVIVIARKVGDDGCEHVVTYGEGAAHCAAAARAGMAVKHHLMGWPTGLFDDGLRVSGVGRDAENAQATSVTFNAELTDDQLRAFEKYVKPPTYAPAAVEAGEDAAD